MAHPFDNFSTQLWEASAHAARFLVSEYQSTDRHALLRASLSLGLAAEQLMMACVAEMDTALLASKTSAPTMVALSKANKTGVLDPHTVKTISWREALLILRHVDAKFGVASDLEFVMDTRNAAAHIAMVDSADLAEAVLKLVHVVGALHAYLPTKNEDDYWGPTHLAVVTGLRDARADRVQSAYDAKILAAKEAFDRLNAALSAGDQASVAILLESRPPNLMPSGQDGSESERAECPACGRQGHLHYSLLHLEDYEEEVDYDSDGHAENVYVMVSVEWEPIEFECGVCGLQLTSDEVILVPGIATFIADEKHVLDGDELRAYSGYDDYERDFDNWK